MNIGICALGDVGSDTGGQTYIRNFVRMASELSDGDCIFFFVGSTDVPWMQSDHSNVKIITVPFSSPGLYRRLAGEHIILPELIRQYDIDVMYYPNNFTSLNCPVPCVVAIRSTLYYHYPYAIDGLRLRYRKAMAPRSARQAVKIICPSNDIKIDILNYIGVDSQKIEVVHHGIDVKLFGRSFTDKEFLSVAAPLGIRKPFLMYVSALWEYKNQDILIESFARLIQDHSIPHQLVIVGKGLNTANSYEQKLRDLPKQLGIENRVIFTGFQSHDVLKYLYCNTDVFVFPSSYESFGNPLFEAMAAGVPIVAANTHSFPEMAGDAALLINPRDHRAMADAIYSVITDTKLKAQLIANGKKRIIAFDWNVCFQKTMNIIRKAGKEK